MMPPDNWSRLESLFQQALDLPQAEKIPFLCEACKDDQDIGNSVSDFAQPLPWLRMEIMSLWASTT